MLTDRLRPHLELISTLTIVATCALLISANWSRLWPPPSDPLPTAPVSLAGAAVKGSSTAPVALIVFTDYQCPSCRRFEVEVLPLLVREYVEPGKAVVAVRHLPLTKIHPIAFHAASAATCALPQGKFWQLHDVMFEQQKGLTAEKVNELAAGVGIDMTTFGECMGDAGPAQVTTDLEMARTMGLASTPAILIGRVRGDGTVLVLSAVRGVKPTEQFARAVEQGLIAPWPWISWLIWLALLAAVGAMGIVIRRKAMSQGIRAADQTVR